jgi:hypothetical protein
VASTTGSHDEPLSKVTLLLLVFILVSNHPLKAMKLIHPCRYFEGCTGERDTDPIYRKHSEAADKLCEVLFRGR